MRRILHHGEQEDTEDLVQRWCTGRSIYGYFTDDREAAELTAQGNTNLGTTLLYKLCSVCADRTFKYGDEHGAHYLYFVEECDDSGVSAHERFIIHGGHDVEDVASRLADGETIKGCFTDSQEFASKIVCGKAPFRYDAVLCAINPDDDEYPYVDDDSNSYKYFVEDCLAGKLKMVNKMIQGSEAADTLSDKGGNMDSKLVKHDNRDYVDIEKLAHRLCNGEHIVGFFVDAWYEVNEAASGKLPDTDIRTLRTIRMGNDNCVYVNENGSYGYNYFIEKVTCKPVDLNKGNNEVTYKENNTSNGGNGMDTNEMMSMALSMKLLNGKDDMDMGKLMLMQQLTQGRAIQVSDVLKSKLISTFNLDGDTDSMDLDKLMMLQMLEEGKLDIGQLMCIKMLSSEFGSDSKKQKTKPQQQ